MSNWFKQLHDVVSKCGKYTIDRVCMLDTYGVLIMVSDPTGWEANKDATLAHINKLWQEEKSITHVVMQVVVNDDYETMVRLNRR